MESKAITFIVAALVVGAALGAGIGFIMFGNSDSNAEETYSYYIYFGEGEAKNGWYTAKATDASAGFDKAMKNAGMEWEKSPWGYIKSVNGESGSSGWAVFEYLYKDCNSDAQTGSISYASGWRAFAGYTVTGEDDPSLKLKQSDSNVWFLSLYGPAPEYTMINPWDDAVSNKWMNSGPFASA